MPHIELSSEVPPDLYEAVAIIVREVATQEPQA
jgi:type III secretion system FlhB-like substrate exporter